MRLTQRTQFDLSHPMELPTSKTKYDIDTGRKQGKKKGGGELDVKT